MGLNHDQESFAGLLQSYRAMAGLSQEELAERAGLSRRGISDLERGERRSPHSATVRRLAAGLNLDASQKSTLLAGARNVATSAIGAHAQGSLAGPQTSFIGRKGELAEVRRLLRTARLVTLTGVGGCGKTRLAVEVARGLLTRYADGVWLVELGSLADPNLVPQRVATVMGIGELADMPIASSLQASLADRRLLLILDNCEHLLQACAVLVDSVLRSCPGVQILATSRERIGVAGENAWRVPSLPVEGIQAVKAVRELQKNPAVQLFVERALAVQPHFKLTAHSAPAVAQICQRLDGIPLALELAAARIEALTPELLATRLDERFRILTAGDRTAVPRHQTLSATLDWSYSLLTELEQILFERLSVFAGSWSIEAAEAVGFGGPVAQEDVLDLLVSLVRKSLVVADESPGGAGRYRLLQTVREYAHHKLASRGVADMTDSRRRHAAFYSDIAEGLCPALGTIGAAPSGDAATLPMLDRFSDIHDNLRVALRWWLDVNRPDEGLRLAVTMGDFWWLRGMYAEGRYWLEAMLNLADQTNLAPNSQGGAGGISSLELRARALGFAGLVASRQGDYAQASAYHESSVPLWRELDNAIELANALSWVGLERWLGGDADEASAILRESLTLARAAGDGDAIAAALRNLGIVARSQAQYTHASVLFHEAASLAHSSGWRQGYPYARAVSHLGRVAYLEGDSEKASVLLREALVLMRASQTAGHALADCLDWLAAVESKQGHAHRAARLFGAGGAQWHASGAVRYAPDRAAYEHDVAAVRGQLGERQFDAEWAWGRAIGADQAIAYALGQNQAEGVVPLEHAANGKPG